MVAKASKSIKKITEEIDLTLNSDWAGDEDDSLLPEQIHQYKRKNDPNQMGKSIDILGITGDSWKRIVINGTALRLGIINFREVNPILDIDPLNSRFHYALIRSYSRIFNEPAPWDEEEYFLKDNCHRCSIVLDFFNKTGGLCLDCEKDISTGNKEFEI